MNILMMVMVFCNKWFSNLWEAGRFDEIIIRQSSLLKSNCFEQHSRGAMITRKMRLTVLLFFVLTLPWPAQIVFADTGPKPTMDFQFEQASTNSRLIITSGTLYECEQPDCSDAAPLQDIQLQEFTCDANSCHALAYGFSTYHRLEIEFSDGQTLQSNIFKTAGFNSEYTVTIHQEDLLVKAKLTPGNFPIATIIIVACLCALIAGALLAALIIFLVRRSRKK